MAKRTERQIDIILGARNEAGPAINGMLRQLDKTAAKVLAVGTVTAGLGAITRGYVQDVTEAASATAEFEADLTGLLSLGDNLSSIQAIRSNVLSMSNAWGIARGEVADAMFVLQSGTANLSEAQRQDLMQSALELSKVYGVDLETALTGVTKAYQIYGGEVQNVSELQGKIALLAEEGFLNFQDVATLLPDVASAADAVGTSFDELVSLLIVSTQRGGDVSKTFTGVRNVLLRMANAQKEGIQLTGSLTNQLRQLGGVDVEVLKKIFGDEALSTANNLISAVDEIDGALLKVGDSAVDVGEKLAQAFEDPTRAAAELMGLIENLNANQFALMDPQALSHAEQYELALSSIMRSQMQGTYAGVVSQAPLAEPIMAAADGPLGNQRAMDTLITLLDASIRQNNKATAAIIADRIQELRPDEGGIEHLRFILPILNLVYARREMTREVADVALAEFESFQAMPVVPETQVPTRNVLDDTIQSIAEAGGLMFEAVQSAEAAFRQEQAAAAAEAAEVAAAMAEVDEQIRRQIMLNAGEQIELRIEDIFAEFEQQIEAAVAAGNQDLADKLAELRDLRVEAVTDGEAGDEIDPADPLAGTAQAFESRFLEGGGIESLDAEDRQGQQIEQAIREESRRTAERVATAVDRLTSAILRDKGTRIEVAGLA